MTTTADIRPPAQHWWTQATRSATHGGGPDIIEVPVLYQPHDDGTWTYRIVNPAILGGPHRTRHEAELCAVGAFTRALRGGENAAEPGEVTGLILVTLSAVCDHGLE